MLHQRTPGEHNLGLPSEPLLGTLQYRLMLPATNAAFSPGSALGLDRTTRASRGPVAPDLLAAFFTLDPERQSFSGRALVLIFILDVPERRTIELALGLVGRGLGLRYVGDDASLLALADLLAVLVALVGNHL